jgi:hypothetical protein
MSIDGQVIEENMYAKLQADVTNPPEYIWN